MKKLLIVLMVVAVSSFLFVGCLGDGVGVTPPVDDVDGVDDVLTSTTPVLTDVQTSAEVSIFDVASTSTLYMNEDEAGSSILVKGTGPAESVVKIYIDDVALISVAETAVTGLWSIAIAESSLGDDGVKVLHATVTEVGLAESVASNSVTFTLDTVDPGIDSVAFTANSDVTAADLDLTTQTTNALVTIITASNTLVPVQAIVAGKWTIASLADSGVDNNIKITSPSGTSTSYNVSDLALVTDDMIPGIQLKFGTILAATGDASVTISVTTATLATVAGRATIKFTEDIGYAGMTAGTFAGGLVSADPDVYKESNKTGYYTSETIGENTSFIITVYGITDKAGNSGGTSTSPLSATATAGAASATALKP